MRGLGVSYRSLNEIDYNIRPNQILYGEKLEDQYSLEKVLQKHDAMNEFKKELAELLERYEVGRLTDSQIPNQILTNAVMQSLTNILGFQWEMDDYFISG